MKKIALLAMAVILAGTLWGCAGGEEADKTAPTISGVSASDITQTTATITWTTDEPASSQVEYGLTTSYGSTTPLDSSLLTSHSVTLNDLDENTTYHYRVKSKDASENEAVSADQTLTTAPDTTPPAVSAVSASDITPWTATITWTTDELATSEVEYGLTTTYGSTAFPLLPALVTSHSVSLSGLDENTTYHYRVKSKDASDNEAVSADYTFTTNKAFPGPNLEAAIREAVGKPEGAIGTSDLEGLTTLNASERDITDLTGLEYCHDLTELDLSDNQISDVSSLSGLTSLTRLRLGYNQIDDISPLSNLTSLTNLSVYGNQISDITPVHNLTSLTGLNLYNNQIGDISTISNLTSLTWVDLGGNQISDISIISNLTSLIQLFLWSNNISDITPLATVTSLTELRLDGNQIGNISPLANLANLTELNLHNNLIVDILSLVDNEGLSEGDYIDLRGNPLSSESLCTLIPQLEARGVTVQYDEPLAFITYIYMSDTESANSYGLFLEDNDYCVTLISMDNVATTDFSTYGLIIVGSDTEGWDSPGLVSAVDISANPIIGLGEGGYDFFGQLGLDIGRPYGWHGSDNSIYVVDASHLIFNTPNAITIPEGSIIQLYTATNHVGIDLPSIPENVVVFGREVDDVEHYPLTLENGRYLFWGFTASPDNMTQICKDLFLNVVDFMLGAS
jgi:Leucine-rich repeat (LRR) protein